MKVPDKLYCGIQELDTGYVYALSLDNNGHPEYIRKDALLDWIKLAYGKVSMNPFDCSEAFEELIDKINSM